MCWPQGLSTTASTLTLLSGTGPTTRCVSGSPSMPTEFVARLHARPTSGVRSRADGTHGVRRDRDRVRRRSAEDGVGFPRLLPGDVLGLYLPVLPPVPAL